MLLQIERVDQVAAPVAKPNYTIYEFMCSGWIEGEYVAQIKVQTLSGKEADYVQPGWAGQVEVDNKFDLHYKIPTPQQGQDGQGKAQGLQPVRNSQQAQAPSPAPAGNAPPPPPPTQGFQPKPPPAQGKKVVFMDLMADYATCLQAAEHILKTGGYTAASTTFEDVRAIACSLNITAQRGGVHIPAPRPVEAKSEQRAEPEPAAPEQPPEQPPEPETTQGEDPDDLPF